MDTQNSGGDGAGKWLRRFGSLIRRKQVDSAQVKGEGQQLAKRLAVLDLIAIGIGATIGAGVYILVGTLAREHTGPALSISFLIAGIAAGLSAFCYAELACRCPSAGSAYHYSYVCIGEGVAWLIGWSLVLEYTLGGSAVARGVSPNMALFFGGEDKLPSFLARHTLPGLDIVVDPSAAVLVMIVTLLLCFGIKESTVAQTVVTAINVCALVFIIVAGGYLGFQSGWAGYGRSSGLFPFGFNGMVSGSGMAFFSYIGFDSVTSTAEEVKNPQRDLPLGIALALGLCCILYMLVSSVVVGLVPYSALDPDTPISSAFATYDMQWAVYIVTTGAVTALVASLLGSILPQPRILMAMARDGLLPSFFSEINKRTQVPVNATILTGVFSAILAFFMDVSQLAGMVSVGTLLAFTMVAVSVLILRYVPPDEVPLPSSLVESVDSSSLHFGNVLDQNSSPRDPAFLCESAEGNMLLRQPLIIKVTQDEQKDRNRRQIAAWTIGLLCVGVVILASAAIAVDSSRTIRFSFCGIGGGILLSSVTVLACIDQDEGRHSFGHAGGFVCPFVPYLPAACILVNTYLLFDLGSDTWARVSVWLVLGELVYIFYSRNHSSLRNAVYVPLSRASEINQGFSDPLS